MTILDCRLPLDATGSPPALTSLRRLDDALVYDPRPPCGSRRTRTGSKYDCSWEGFALPDPPTGWGDRETGFPHPPAPAAIRFNEGDGPLPDPPPPGEGTRLLPPAGGGWEGGRILRTVFTSGGVRPGNLRVGEAGAGGVGAGKPRPYAGPPPGRGFVLPDPPAGGRMGKPGFPIALGPMFTSGVNHAYRTDRTQTDRTAICHAL